MYFASQCRPLLNGSVLPLQIPRLKNYISNIYINEDIISSIINKLNSNKAHGCDDISIAMLKLCSQGIETAPSYLPKESVIWQFSFSLRGGATIFKVRGLSKKDYEAPPAPLVASA